MGCRGKEKDYDFDKCDFKDCVCDILRDIKAAQDEVAGDNCCDYGCKQSIDDLVGGTMGGNGRDTIPVILYCEGTCKPFKGFGGKRCEDNSNNFDVKESFFFRVKDVDDDCCATLELLLSPETGSDCGCECPAEQETEDLSATGICITVDLKCFCHVTCLPAISAL
ncbi:CotY/CotZ family spore coat protein [Halobacillus amylolyticus]|uniref:Spore coat protein n=1 Tax=Halobacillus amylolyticus TaxID=2932259 RepID=A0ABY4HFF2_9BACI|nr:CotY/CotZ family spore coat protein [Halobacillus amylolyticus]UOR13108.1 spore coat protein [Halobacillus amylolyticus]